jgi:hypothetical protein
MTMRAIDKGAAKGSAIGAAAGAAVGLVCFLVAVWLDSPHRLGTQSSGGLLLLCCCIAALCGGGLGAAFGTLAGMWWAQHFRVYDPHKPYLDVGEARAGRLCGAAFGLILGLPVGSIGGNLMWQAGVLNDGGAIAKLVPALGGSEQGVWTIFFGLGGLYLGAFLGGRVGARSDRRAAAIVQHSISLHDPEQWVDVVPVSQEKH